MNQNTVYDKACKRVICNVEILSRILKYLVVEFNDISLDEIKKEILDIGNGDYITLKDGIYGLNRSIRIGNGKIIFDVYFRLAMQKNEREYFDIEIENKKPEKREMYAREAAYVSSMILAQKNKEYNARNYRKLKKVHSLWIMTHASLKMDGKIEKSAVTRGFEEYEEIYDRIDARRIYLSPRHKLEDKYEKYDEILTPLHVLLTNKYDENTKKRVLKEYGIHISEELEEEVHTMCNLGEGVYNDGRRAGRRAGRKEGIELGKKQERIQSKFESIKILMKNLDVGIDKAMDLLEVEEKDRSVFKEMIVKS